MQIAHLLMSKRRSTSVHGQQGRPHSKRRGNILLRELKSYGLPVSLVEFQAKTPKGKVAMKNIIAELPGSSPEVIILASHYDTKPYNEFTFVGANDGGSSTGALLEIARVLKQQGPRKFTYQFVFFDGEEAFCEGWSECLGGKDNTYGSRHMADQLRATGQLKKIKALILLDMIGDKVSDDTTRAELYWLAGRLDLGNSSRARISEGVSEPHVCGWR